jgi:hypothetical protein
MICSTDFVNEDESICSYRLRIEKENTSCLHVCFWTKVDLVEESQEDRLGAKNDIANK